MRTISTLTAAVVLCAATAIPAYANSPGNSVKLLASTSIIGEITYMPATSKKTSGIAITFIAADNYGCQRADHKVTGFVMQAALGAMASKAQASFGNNVVANGSGGMASSAPIAGVALITSQQIAEIRTMSGALYIAGASPQQSDAISWAPAAAPASFNVVPL